MSDNFKDLPLFAMVEHKVEDNGALSLFHQRIEDGYINATELCKSCGKEFKNWRRLVQTNDFLKALASEVNISHHELIQSIIGGTPHMQGTWVHPQVAINLGQWLSPKFAVAVSKWVLDWMSGKTQTQSKLPYHLERYVLNAKKIPINCFSMLNEMTINLIAPLENQGYKLPEYLLPDISQGKMFCSWLRKEKGIEPNSFDTYIHEYQDGRKVQAKLYPNELLADFRKHFYDVWITKRSIDYFKEKDAKALPYLDKVLALLDGIKIEPYNLESKKSKPYKQNNPTSAQFIKNIQADNPELKENNDFEKNIEKVALSKVKNQ